MPTKIGRKFTLWHLDEVRENAWIDGLGNSRITVVVGAQIPVVVTRVKTVSSNGKQIEELEAVSVSGIVYIRSQEEHPRGAISHRCSWTDGEKKFSEACCAYNDRLIPYVTANGERAIPVGATICKTHAYAYMPDDSDGCLYC